MTELQVCMEFMHNVPMSSVFHHSYFLPFFFRCYELIGVKNIIQPNDGMFLNINQRRALTSTKEQLNRIREEKCNKILKDRIKLSRMMNKIAKERAILHCELEVSKKNLVVGHLKKK